MKFLFTCGGTAGHINPAVGVAGQLKQLFPDAEFLFIGARGRMEMDLVPREGYDIVAVDIDNLSRSLSLAGLRHNLRTVKSVVKSQGEARAILRDFRPDAVIGTGGYVCYPVLTAARSLGIPALVHESNAVPGLTTRLLCRRVDCVMTGFPGVAERYPKGTRVEYTGTPVRRDFTASRVPEKAELGLPPERPLVVSVWGSLGSGHINGLMPEFFRRAAEGRRFTVVHSAGKQGYPALREKTAALHLGEPARDGVDLREYIFNMPQLMAAADLVMCRSGASTLAELAALGKPALLIPSPNVTNHHQEKNARLLEEQGAAKVLLEGSFDAAVLYKTVAELLEDRGRLAEMSAAMKRSGRDDAAERIAELVLDFLK